MLTQKPKQEKERKKGGETYTANPLGVTFQTPLSLNSLIAPPSAACSTNLASKKSLQVNLATSRFIRKVVVVVVVIILRGFLGSGERLDWANLREERLKQASSLFNPTQRSPPKEMVRLLVRKVKEEGKNVRRERVRVEFEELPVVSKIERNHQRSE